MSNKLTYEQISGFALEKERARKALRQNIWQDISVQLAADAKLESELNNWKEDVGQRLTDVCTPKLEDGPLKQSLLDTFQRIKEGSHENCLNMLDALAEQYDLKRPPSPETGAPPLHEATMELMHKAFKEQADKFRELYAKIPVSHFMSLIQMDKAIPAWNDIRNVYYARGKGDLADKIDVAYKGVQGPEKDRLHAYLEASKSIFEQAGLEFEHRNNALTRYFENFVKGKHNGGWVIATEDGTPAIIIPKKNLHAAKKDTANATVLPADHLAPEHKQLLLKIIQECPEGDDKFQAKECKMQLEYDMGHGVQVVEVNAIAVRDHNGLPVDPKILKKAIKDKLGELNKEIPPAPVLPPDPPPLPVPTPAPAPVLPPDPPPLPVPMPAPVPMPSPSAPVPQEKKDQGDDKQAKWSDMMPWIIGAIGSLAGIGLLVNSKRKAEKKTVEGGEKPVPAFKASSAETSIGAVSDPNKPMRVNDGLWDDEKVPQRS